MPNDKVWIGGERLKAWKAKSASFTDRSNNTSSAQGSSSNQPDQNRGKIFHLLGVVRGGTDVYPAVQGNLSIDVDGELTNHIEVACLLDTGCLFANLNKEDIARRLGTNAQSADRQRLVTLADGSITSSVGYVMCDVTLKHG